MKQCLLFRSRDPFCPSRKKERVRSELTICSYINVTQTLVCKLGNTYFPFSVIGIGLIKYNKKYPENSEKQFELLIEKEKEKMKELVSNKPQLKLVKEFDMTSW